MAFRIGPAHRESDEGPNDDRQLLHARPRPQHRPSRRWHDSDAAGRLGIALVKRLARAVTDRATPVGSGTVARTKRIPVEQRAEAAVIAWMRHQTTAYDSLKIPRIKGKRREVRRMLAKRSQELLSRYRQGAAVGEENVC